MAVTNTPSVAGTFDEIRAILQELPGPDRAAGAAALARTRSLAGPSETLGRLPMLVHWMAEWQGRDPPRLLRPRVAIFAAEHGIAARATPYDIGRNTAELVGAAIEGDAAINQLCRTVDADLRVYEMALEKPTRDFSGAPAMDESECVRALSYGMMAVEPGIDILVLGDMGRGNVLSAAALCLGLFGERPADWIGEAAGERFGALLASAVDRHRSAIVDPLTALSHLGGFEIAAIAGAIIAARMARVPVLLDGLVGAAAGAVLFACERSVLDHCQYADTAPASAHAHLLDRFGKVPLLGAGLGRGEAVPGTMCVPILRAAIEIHTGMAEHPSR